MASRCLTDNRDDMLTICIDAHAKKGWHAWCRYDCVTQVYHLTSQNGCTAVLAC